LDEEVTILARQEVTWACLRTENQTAAIDCRKKSRPISGLWDFTQNPLACKTKLSCGKALISETR
jgi:hypothetical protein